MKMTQNRSLRRLLGGIGLYCAAILLSTFAHAALNVQVNVGESVPLAIKDVSKIAIADETIADVTPLSETEISVIGKKAGVTTLTIVHSDGKPTELYRVEVNLSAGVRSIHEALGHNISVREVGDSVVLEGKVENEQQAERALKIAAAYKANVVNLIEVTAPRQIKIRTRLIEVRTEVIKKLGIQFFGPNGEVRYAYGRGSISEGPGAGSDAAGHGFLDPVTSGAQTIGAATIPLAIEARLRLLAQKDAARILSEPTLVTLSGKEASFLSGGEVPIVQTLANTSTVEFKEFGVRMKVKPTVDSEGNIATHILAEVSDVNGDITVSGVPSFRTRRAETHLQVKDGQTIVIGGLLSNQRLRDAVRKIPWLGDVPVLGVLFRSKDYQANQSELLIFVTPSVVKDIDGDALDATTMPAMKKWHEKEADAELRQPEKADPNWQKPLEVDELKLKPEPAAKSVKAAPAPAAEGVTPAAAGSAPSQNFDTARPTQN